MRHLDKTPVVQLGASGLVAETMQSIIAKHSNGLELEAIGAANPENANKKLVEINPNCPPALRDVAVIGLDEAVNNTESSVIVSALRDDAAAEYELRAASGRLLVTNAAVHRERPGTAMFNAYIGGNQLEDMLRAAQPENIAGVGNCGTVIADVALAPLYRELGLKSLHFETLQGWSGKGLREVPHDKIGEIVDISYKTDEATGLRVPSQEKIKLETETNRFLGSLGWPTEIKTAAMPKRAPWVSGHHLRVTAHLEDLATKEQVEKIWRDTRAPAELKHLQYGQASPRSHPIKPTQRELLEYGDHGPRKIRKTYPMQVKTHVREIKEHPEGGSQLVFEVAGDNLILGAAGSAIMTVVYAKRKGYLGQ